MLKSQKEHSRINKKKCLETCFQDPWQRRKKSKKLRRPNNNLSQPPNQRLSKTRKTIEIQKLVFTYFHTIKTLIKNRKSVDNRSHGRNTQQATVLFCGATVLAVQFFKSRFELGFKSVFLLNFVFTYLRFSVLFIASNTSSRKPCTAASKSVSEWVCFGDVSFSEACAWIWSLR